VKATFATVAVVAVGVVVASMRSTEAQPKIPPIVERASVYVDDFVQRFTNVVAEERYVQQTISPRRQRELLSDFLLVQPQGLTDWYQFRDVIEVDGKPIGGRDQRLTKLFLEAPRNALERAREVSSDAKRYNLAELGGVDMPLLSIGLLQSSYVTHFTYSVGRVDKDSGPTVRIVKFEEWQRPTILRQNQANQDYLSHGWFYIDESNGRVLRTEFDLDRRALPLKIITTFTFDEALQVIVPVKMETPLGVATYGRFRKFNVQTEEKIR
jgi:hypothetical protein